MQGAGIYSFKACHMKTAQKYRSWVEIDLDSFRHNWKVLKRLTGKSVAVLQVVKADAYGHGAIEISKAAVKHGASSLGVANADEGIQLRISGIDAPVIILSPSSVFEINEIIKYRLIPSVSDAGFARELERRMAEEGSVIPVHIEIDTGMGRGGTIHYEALSMIKEVMALSHIKVEGIFSHLASSEREDDPGNLLQWDLFRGILDELEKHHIRIPLRHFSNSGAILNFPRYNLDMVRPGIMTYGIYPGPSTETKAALMPVMSFKTSIVLLKEFPENYGIGYGRTYVTGGRSKIATIPVGYGDGYGWILSNQGEALVHGARAPIVGRVSMDMCTVDVTRIPECRVGDEVVLMGRQGDGYIPAGDIAAKAGTISYEVLCALGKRAPRVFVNKGGTGTVEPRLRRVFIPDEEKSIARINHIIRSCFHARAENDDLGDAIFYEMFETLFGKENRPLELRTGFRYDINVSEFSQEEMRADGTVKDYFKVTTEIEYSKTLRHRSFMIGCAMNNEQLAALFDDDRCEYRWLLSGRSSLIGENDFRVDTVEIDDMPVPIESMHNTPRGYEVWCGGDLLKKKEHRQVKIGIRIITKKYKASNIFSVFLVYPTRGLEISFDYSRTGMKNVREVSFFAGKHPTPEVTVERGKAITLKVSENDWVFPTSGVTFIWDL